MSEEQQKPEGQQKKRTRRSPKFLALLCVNSATPGAVGFTQIAEGVSVKACMAAIQSGGVDVNGQEVAFVCVHDRRTPKVQPRLDFKW